VIGIHFFDLSLSPKSRSFVSTNAVIITLQNRVKILLASSSGLCNNQDKVIYKPTKGIPLRQPGKQSSSTDAK